ncbi:alpha/beta fold hydrolase [Noviherbaspirillum aridicola]|uniref:Hydrolase n=1 Tax=Noviherbaspirillum aridicola TaxID=2849687 RepID=A0ABQ4Q264_9BURK|nr:alpha/beta hydrolase [Noviherbaspirillum aridicola]GIZ51224.1 hydrolase [Noviherbaspirillum aridicola]
MPIIEANNIKLAYDIQGPADGEPLLLIAGLGMQLTSWPDAFCRELAAQGFRVIRFDNRDCGQSSRMEQYGKPNLHLAFFKTMFHMPLLSGYTLNDMARDAVGLLDALGIERAHVAGASMGGMIAQIMAARHPERVITLTSIMSTTGRPGLPGPTMAAANAMFSRPANPRDPESVIAHYVRLFRVIGSPAYPTPEAELVRRVRDNVRRGASFSGTSRQVMAVASTGSLVPQLRTIRLPTLVIHGSDDPLVPVACGRDTARTIPGAVMHEVPGMGHDIPPQLEVELARLIAAHCRREWPEQAQRA